MKIARYLDSNGRTRIGVVDDISIIGVDDCESISEVAAGAHDLRALLADGGARVALDEVMLLPPVAAEAPNVYCVGWNYPAHVAEGADRRTATSAAPNPLHPTLFSKAAASLTSPFGPITLHEGVTAELDWEAELGIVIGPGGRGIGADSAAQHVFGYTIANDVTARDVQRNHGGQWFKGKSLDSTCPIGPWIVTRDEIEDVGELVITCSVNGAVKQRAQVGEMFFSVERIIAELSAGLTLRPGDIVLTGTPHGTGHGDTPPTFLRDGDILETSISRIGTLRNTVQAAPGHGTPRDTTEPEVVR